MNIFCPKCYRDLEVSDWESDSALKYYRCKKECCEIQFKEPENICLLYQFTFSKLPYTLIGCSNLSEYNENITMLVTSDSRIKKIIETKEFIPVTFDFTLPSQVEKIYKRLMRLRAFS